MNPYQPISHQNPPYGKAPSPSYQGKTYTLEDQKLPAQFASENPQLLGESSLKIINQQMDVLQKDIHQNNTQIRLLNNKIIRSDFENAQLKKLFQKQQKLNQKRQQYQQILQNHEFLKQQILNSKLNESQIRHSLGQEYQSIVQSRKRMERQQKQRQKEEELAMINMNKEAQAYERQRKRQLFQQQKRLAQQQLRQKQEEKERERQQKINQKIQYNQILNHRNQLQTQKDHVYRQYYNHFKEQQDKLQTIYKQKAFESNLQKQKERQQQEKKQYETFQMRMARQNQEKLRKITQERESLKNFLQSQIQESHKRKALQREDQLRYQNQVRSYQTNINSYQLIERQKKRQTQKRYDQELAYQIQMKNKISQQKMQQAYRSSSMGRVPNLNSSQYTERKTHNPVTNPIDFKIGITNPYVIKEYENTKQKYMGDNNLKLRNLAMIGNNSLITSRH